MVTHATLWNIKFFNLVYVLSLQTDYLSKISQKMVDMETKYQNNTIANNVPSNQVSTCNKLPN
jgi:hypothetical protein